MIFIIVIIAGACVVMLAIYSETHPDRPPIGHWATHVLAWIVGFTQAVLVGVLTGGTLP